MNIADALTILQYVVATRTPAAGCPLGNTATEIWLPAADVNDDTNVTIADALTIMQCVVGQTNPLCP